jgi:kynureninase
MPVYHALLDESVIVDVRKPDTFRVSPAPLYNSFSDIAAFVDVFTSIIKTHAPRDAL